VDQFCGCDYCEMMRDPHRRAEEEARVLAEAAGMGHAKRDRAEALLALQTEEHAELQEIREGEEQEAREAQDKLQKAHTALEAADKAALLAADSLASAEKDGSLAPAEIEKLKKAAEDRKKEAGESRVSREAAELARNKEVAEAEDAAVEAGEALDSVSSRTETAEGLAKEEYLRSLNPAERKRAQASGGRPKRGGAAPAGTEESIAGELPQLFLTKTRELRGMERALAEAARREEKLTTAGANPALIKGVQKSNRQMKRQVRVCTAAVEALRDDLLAAGMEQEYTNAVDLLEEERTREEDDKADQQEGGVAFREMFMSRMGGGGPGGASEAPEGAEATDTAPLAPDDPSDPMPDGGETAPPEVPKDPPGVLPPDHVPEEEAGVVVEPAGGA